MNTDYLCADEDARETMENLCSAALEFQATMYSLPIRAEYNIHVETLALFSKISTSVARQVGFSPRLHSFCRTPHITILPCMSSFRRPAHLHWACHNRRTTGSGLCHSTWHFTARIKLKGIA